MNNVAFTFGFDAAGEIPARAVTDDAYTAIPSAKSEIWTANALDQYATINGAASQYDLRGDTLYDALTTHSFTYDLSNRLTSASNPTPVSLAYDPIGRLASSTANGATTSFLFAGQMLVGEYSASGAILSRYIPGPAPDEALLWYSGAGTASPHWLATDNLGSTIAWSTSAGVNGAVFAYHAFGSPGANGWGTGPRYRYTGQLEIPEGHVWDFKARAYQDQLGRFLQPDPAGWAGRMNLYAYAGNDPINATDPTGMYVPASAYVQAISPIESEMLPAAQDFVQPPTLLTGLDVFANQAGTPGSGAVGGGGGGGAASNGSNDPGTRVAELVVVANRSPRSPTVKMQGGISGALTFVAMPSGVVSSGPSDDRPSTTDCSVYLRQGRPDLYGACVSFPSTPYFDRVRACLQPYLSGSFYEDPLTHRLIVFGAFGPLVHGMWGQEHHSRNVGRGMWGQGNVGTGARSPGAG